MLTPFLRDAITPVEDLTDTLNALQNQLDDAHKPLDQVRLLNLIGTTYRTSSEPERAIAWFVRALEIARRRNLRKEIAVTALRLGVAQQYVGMEAEAGRTLQAALQMCERMDVYVDFAWQHWGKFLVESGQTEQGIAALEQALHRRMMRGGDDLINSSRQALAAARERLLLSGG